jgi:hypothetical protein
MAAFVPVYVLHSSSHNAARELENKSIDFFCKTHENKTLKEINYCDNFYRHQAAVDRLGAYFLIYLILVIILFGIFLNKSFDWEYGGFKLAGICILAPAALFFVMSCMP